MIYTRLFLYKTEKLSSAISITQVPKILKNSKTQFQTTQKQCNSQKFDQKMLEKGQYQIVFALKTFNFLNNSVPKWQKLSFPEILQT